MGAGCAASASDLNALDRLARGRSPIHAHDPRVKLLAVLAFALAVVSMDKYALGEMLPFGLFPIFLLARSGVPAGLVVRRVLLVVPFALMVGLFNPLLDTTPLLHIGGVAISGGWVSFASIALRGLLTISALVLLVATTDIPALALGAEKLGMPRIFVAQMLGLYRYLFLLSDESRRMLLAYRLRCPGAKPPKIRAFAAILGQLLLRSINRAERVYQAMWLRGFEGEVKRMNRLRLVACDWRFLAIWLGVFAVLRFLHPASWLGQIVLGAA